MVELDEQIDELRGLGVHMGQGYLFGVPAPQPVFSSPGARTTAKAGTRRA